MFGKQIRPQVGKMLFFKPQVGKVFFEQTTGGYSVIPF